MLSQNQSIQTHRSIKILLNPTKKPIPDASELTSIIEENGYHIGEDYQLQYSEYEEASLLKDILIQKQIQIALLRKKLDKLRQIQREQAMQGYNTNATDHKQAHNNHYQNHNHHISDTAANNLNQAGLNRHRRQTTSGTTPAANYYINSYINMQQDEASRVVDEFTPRNTHNNLGFGSPDHRHQHNQMPSFTKQQEIGSVNLVEVRKNKHRRIFSEHVKVMPQTQTDLVKKNNYFN